MKRSEFLRLSILASIGAVVAPKLLLKEPEHPYYKRKVAFKASKELLEDQKAFDKVIKDHNTHGKLKEIQTGWENDDFTKNMMTIVLTFETKSI